MVGVPGRSKGCKGCKRRKKRCSLKKPICDLCKRLGEVCDYDRDTIFISVGEDTWKQGTYSAGYKRRNDSQGPLKTPKTQDLSPTGDQLVRVAFREQLLSQYLTIHENATRPTLASWLSVMPSLVSPDKALETSAYAVCTSRLGQLYDDPVLKHESLRLYTLGVRQLHVSLKDPNRLYTDETLGACIALALYEILEGERDTYAKHADGAAQLIQFRGPERHKSGLGHRIFLGYRFMGTLRAMEKKSSTFLARPDWLTIPWTTIPKSSFDELLDIATQAPELIQRGEDIAGTPLEHQYEAGAKLFRDCLNLYDQIQDFHVKMNKMVDGQLCWPVHSSTAAVDHYEFANEEIAATLIMIWSYSLMIKSGLKALCGMLTHFQQIGQGKPDEKFELRDGDDLAEPAKNILLSVEYCIKNSAIELRSPAIMAPLAIVIDVLRHWPEYREQYLAARIALQSISQLGFKMVWPPLGES